MLKKTFFLFIGVIFFSALVLLSFEGTVEAKVITLRYAEGHSQNSFEAKNTTIPWVKAVENATTGRVKIDVYWNDTLCKPMDSWEATKSGVADIAFAMMGFWPGMVPLADVFSLPSLPFESSEQASIIAWKLFEQYPSLQNQFRPLKVLALSPSSAYQLLTSKKQVRTMEDIKGMKLRIAGGPPTDYIKSMGGVPVAMGMGEVYTNLQKGIIDGMGVAKGTIPTFRLYEVAKYYTHIPLFHYYAAKVMNPNTWNSLPPDIQDAIMSVSGLEASRKWGKNTFDEGGAVANSLWEKAGYEVIEYTPPEEELARWRKAAEPFISKWVENMTAAGYDDAPAILESLQTMIKTVKP